MKAPERIARIIRNILPLALVVDILVAAAASWATEDAEEKLIIWFIATLFALVLAITNALCYFYICRCKPTRKVK
jgi:hypothetical protein